MLREHGHEAEHVTDIGPGDVPDRDLWRYAIANQAVIVTKDEDFSYMIAHGGKTPSVVWVRVGNTRRAVLLPWFEPLIAEIVRLIGEGIDSSNCAERSPHPTGWPGSPPSPCQLQPLVEPQPSQT